MTAANSGSYAVVTGNGNCYSSGSNTENVNVTTNIGPAPSLTVVNDVLCEGETLELNSSFFASNNVSYNWYFNNGTSNVLLGTTNNPTFYVQDLDANDVGISRGGQRRQLHHAAIEHTGCEHYECPQWRSYAHRLLTRKFAKAKR